MKPRAPGSVDPKATANNQFARPLLWLTIAVAAAYAWTLFPLISPYASGADQSGYLNFAKLLLHSELLATVRSLPGHSVAEFGTQAFQPLGFLVRDGSGMMAPTYPIGYPIQLALTTLAVGTDHAAAAANVLLAGATALLMYASCRYLGLAPIWCAGATLALLACPIFINCAVQPMSDLPAATWSLLALYAAMRSRERASWAILCGAAASMALLVRPSNLLLALPIMVAFGRQPKPYAWAVLGALPGLLALVYVNWRLYGTLPMWKTTGYNNPMEILGGLTANGPGNFSLTYFRPYASRFIIWILCLLGPSTLLPLALLFSRSGRRREWAMHAVWFGILFIAYSTYRFSGEVWWYLRFLLPGFPSLLILVTGGLDIVWRYSFNSWRPAPTSYTAVRWHLLARMTAASAIGVLTVGWMGLFSKHLTLLDARKHEKAYLDTSYWANALLPPNAIVVCFQVSGAFYYYTDFIVASAPKLDRLKMPSFIAAAAAQGRPLYAVLWPFEVDEFRRRFGANWTPVYRVVWKDIQILRYDPVAQPPVEVRSLPGATEAITTDSVLDMRTGGNGVTYLAGGWSGPEAPGTWTDGARAELGARLAGGAVDLTLEVTALPFLVRDRHPTLNVDVLVNGTAVDRWSYDVARDNHPVARTAHIPAAVLSTSPLLRVEFVIDHPASPASTIDGSNDDRNLGLFISAIKLRH